VPNGGITEGVIMGFCKGYLMSNAESLLQSNGRQEVLTMHYVSVAQINQLQLKQRIKEALLIDPY
jgi:hypothetical protein